MLIIDHHFIFDVSNIRLDPAPLKHMGILILIPAEAETHKHFRAYVQIASLKLIWM